MAGSYSHVVKDHDGSLRSQKRIRGMLDYNDTGDVYETIEEMYGMIWYLAHRLDGVLPPGDTTNSVADLVEDARVNWETGLSYSPGPKKSRF